MTKMSGRPVPGRSVRFTPMGLEDSLDPAPVFSPTQMDTHASVLHSVFSPTNRGRSADEDNGNEDDEERDPLEEPPQFSSSMVPRTTSHSSAALGTPSRPYTTPASSHGIHHHHQQSPSPSRRSFKKQLQVNSAGHHNHHHASPTSTITGTVFYSPMSSLDMDSPRSVVSGLTAKTSSSFRSLRDVTLLDLDNIKKCNSISDLQNVIQVLHGEGKFQALLRMAKNRLQTLLEKENKSDTVNNHHNGGTSATRASPAFVNPPPIQTQVIQPPPPPSPQQSQRTLSPRSAPATTTAMTRSPPAPNRVPSPRRSPEIPRSPQEQQQYLAITVADTSPPKPSTTTTPSSSSSPRQLAIESSTKRAGMMLADDGTLTWNTHNTESDDHSSLIMSLSSSMMDANFDDEVPSVSRTSSSSTKRRGNNWTPSPKARCWDRKLSEEVKKLTETVVTMEAARVADRKVFLDKLTALQHHTNAGSHGGDDDDDSKMKTIQGMMHQSSVQTRELLESLEQLRIENQELQDNVRAERMAWRQSYAQAQQLESRLCLQVEELSKKLSAQPAKTISKEDEERIRLQYLAQIAKKQKEHEDTLGNLLVGLGRNKNELRHMTPDQKDALVSTIVKRSLSSKAATEALAQEVATLEQERQEATRAKKTLSAQLERSRRTQAQLEHDNLQLLQKIEQLKDELEAMRKNAQELTEERAQVSDWQQKENRYQTMIKSLQSQLRKEETMVSVSLYKSAVESAREKGKQIEGKRAELENLNQKLSALEAELQEKRQSQSTAETTIQKNQEKSLQRIAELKTQLLEERRTKKQVVAAAKKESDKLKEQIADLRLEMQQQAKQHARNGLTSKSPPQSSTTGRTQAPRSVSPLTQAPPPPPSVKKPQTKNIQQPRVTPVTPQPPPPPPPSTKKSTTGNVLVSPAGGSKQPYRSKFNFVKEQGGRKGLREKLQQHRSPRSQRTTTVM